MDIIATDRITIPHLIQRGNSKLAAAKMYMFNLPAGKEVCSMQCPNCYAFREQTRWTNVKKGRNLRLLASKSLMFAKDVINSLSRLKTKPTFFRVHASGEFYSQEYINNWVTIAEKFPSITFYAYTKRLNHFDFSALKALKNFIVINSMAFKQMNYGPLEKAPSGSFICPDTAGTNVACGVGCTYCMSKSAENNPPYFIEH